MVMLPQWYSTPAGGHPTESRVAYLRGFANDPRGAVVVKLADRYSNVQRLGSHPRSDARRRYYRETVRYIVPLARGVPFFAALFTEWVECYRYLDQAG